MRTQVQFSKPLRKRTLADQVAESIRDAILDGDLTEGENLPTEPQLCQQFGVSRAVIRDATRILMAQGLVDAKQGSGVYVTPAYNAAFGEALLLSLRRVEATAWDVEEFERLLLPEVVAMVAVSATSDEIIALQSILADYLAVHTDYVRSWEDLSDAEIPASETGAVEAHFQRLFRAIFQATHNQVLLLLAEPLTQLHAMRRWAGKEFTVEYIIANERKILNAIVDAIAERDPDGARRAVANIHQLPAEAVTAMKATAIGEKINIQL